MFRCFVRCVFLSCCFISVVRHVCLWVSFFRHVGIRVVMYLVVYVCMEFALSFFMLLVSSLCM